MRQAVAAIARFTVVGCHRLVSDMLRNDRLWRHKQTVASQTLCNSRRPRGQRLTHAARQSSPGDFDYRILMLRLFVSGDSVVAKHFEFSSSFSAISAWLKPR
jgi:hypothetical protein